MYEQLPFIRLKVDLNNPIMPGTELCIAFQYINDKDWMKVLMNYPAYEKSELSYEYEP